MHGLLFEEAAASVQGEAVSVQLGVVIEDEVLDDGSPGLHHIIDQGLLILPGGVKIPNVGVQVGLDNGDVGPAAQNLEAKVEQVVKGLHRVSCYAFTGPQPVGKLVEVLLEIVLRAAGLESTNVVTDIFNSFSSIIGHWQPALDLRSVQVVILHHRNSRFDSPINKATGNLDSLSIKVGLILLARARDTIAVSTP